MAAKKMTKKVFNISTFFKGVAILLSVLIVYLANPVNQAISGDVRIMVPNDFQITLASAGLGIHRAERDSVTISTNGKSRFWSGSNIAGDNRIKKEKKFRVSKDAVRRIYSAVKTHQFFKLDSEYRDASIHDGDLAELTVKRSKSSKMVRTVNIPVNNFDEIARAINQEMPKEFRIHYNALSGF